MNKLIFLEDAALRIESSDFNECVPPSGDAAPTLIFELSRALFFSNFLLRATYLLNRN